MIYSLGIMIEAFHIQLTRHSDDPRQKVLNDFSGQIFERRRALFSQCLPNERKAS